MGQKEKVIPGLGSAPKVIPGLGSKPVREPATAHVSLPTPNLPASFFTPNPIAMMPPPPPPGLAKPQR